MLARQTLLLQLLQLLALPAHRTKSAEARLICVEHM